MKTLVALLFAIAAATAQAQQFPTKPGKIIVPFPPGGSADVSSRILGESMAKRLGQPVLIDNRPGGGTVIGTQLVARSPADDYTLLVVYPSFIVNPTLRPTVGYDPAKDFRAVGQTIAL